MVPDNYALGAIVWRVQVRIHMVPDNCSGGYCLESAGKDTHGA